MSRARLYLIVGARNAKNPHLKSEHIQSLRFYVCPPFAGYPQSAHKEKLLKWDPDPAVSIS